MIYVPFELVYKELPNGRYAYYPFSPMWGWAYEISERERERLIAIDQLQMKLAVSLAAGWAVSSLVWKNFLGLLIVALISLVGLIVTGRRQKKAVLGNRRLERCAPAMTYPEYWYQYASEMSGRDVLRILKAFLVIALVGGSMQYYGIEHGQTGYAVAGGILIFLAVLGLIFGGYCGSVWIRHKRNNKNS